MTPIQTNRDEALNQLTSEFTRIPVRIVLSIFCEYLYTTQSVPVATAATRLRIADACATA